MGLKAKLNKLLSGESEKKKIKVGQFAKASQRAPRGKTGKTIRVGQIGKASPQDQTARVEEFGQEALEAKLKGSVNKEQLMERIKRSDSRGVFSDLELNELAEFEDSCFQHFDSEITEQKDNKRRALGERLDEVDAGKTPSRLKDEKDIDLMR